MQAQQPNPDALFSFSEFLLDKFGLIASMQVALLVSIASHAAVIIGVGFKVPDPKNWTAPHNSLDVVLVNAKSATRPVKADALAQANLDGGGNTDEKRRASSPFPNLPPRDAKQDAREAEARMKRLEQEAKELMTRLAAKSAVVQGELREQVTKPDTAAQDLAEKSLEIARLEAQIRRDYQAYQERPKRVFIGARTQEYRFAQYVDNWRLKIERVGNLNYPEDAKVRKIYGSLQLTVAIKSDGSVESVEINRSSGYKVLDQAAMRIVRLAAPFERFPENIRKDTDIVHITRTWSFTRGDQLLSE
jgi:periplasmic protein TonB